MIKIYKTFLISLSLLAIFILPSKAFIVDVWEVRGASPQEMSEATMAFKEKAMAGGAKYTAFRSSTKLRGDNSNDTTYVYGYYDSYEDQMETAAIVAENPDWFTSTYGEIEFDSSVNSVTWANNSTLGESAAGQTIGYATLEVESGINFVLNVPIMQEMMREAGAPVIVDTLQCAMCPSSCLLYTSPSPRDTG